ARARHSRPRSGHSRPLRRRTPGHEGLPQGRPPPPGRPLRPPFQLRPRGAGDFGRGSRTGAGRSPRRRPVPQVRRREPPGGLPPTLRRVWKPRTGDLTGRGALRRIVRDGGGADDDL
ncbi:MAG: hypothetical protein AVDCRST_MAG05-958, partial [uncultured Rubrobacteraceae bacterium]